MTLKDVADVAKDSGMDASTHHLVLQCQTQKSAAKRQRQQRMCILRLEKQMQMVYQQQVRISSWQAEPLELLHRMAQEALQLIIAKLQANGAKFAAQE